MGLTDLAVSKSAEEMKTEMSSFATGFAERMRKRDANAQGETTPGSEGPDGKCFKTFGPTEEVQIIPTMISSRTSSWCLVGVGG